MGQIRWTEEALGWLEEIHTYISLDNSTAARRVVRGIYDKIQGLAQFPRRGYVYSEHPEPEVRILLHGHYRIAYQLLDGDTVEVLGVFHGALDIDRYLS